MRNTEFHYKNAYKSQDCLEKKFGFAHFHFVLNLSYTLQDFLGHPEPTPVPPMMNLSIERKRSKSTTNVEQACTISNGRHMYIRVFTIFMCDDKT